MQCKKLSSWSPPQFEIIMGSKSHFNIYLLHNYSEPKEIKYTNSTALLLRQITIQYCRRSEDNVVYSLCKPAEVSHALAIHLRADEKVQQMYHVS